jgi:hypothetical protein
MRGAQTGAQLPPLTRVTRRTFFVLFVHGHNLFGQQGIPLTRREQRGKLVMASGPSASSETGSDHREDNKASDTFMGG